MPRKSTSVSVDEITRVAREKFGFEDLRPGQEETIRLALAGHDVLSVMPTGSGKSAIYQIAALFIHGPTVIVSPLIALQKDQMEAIRESSLAPAAVVNSMQRVGEKRDAFEKLEDGELEFLFLSPEQMANEETMCYLLEHRPSLFVVDEAHCLSEWGHDFRPEYARLGKVIEQLGGPRILALTATASPQVRDEIVQRLGMRNAKTVVWGFDRPNIHLTVEACPDESTKRRLAVDRVRDFVRGGQRPGIVYVATRGHAEEVATWLGEEANIEAAFYHAGMKKAERDGAQDAFMTGGVEVIVATNAFGMGVDKPDVRFVIHYDIPESLDAYYQEVGRAGRDGEPARALLLYRPEDAGMRRAMAASGKLDGEHVKTVLENITGTRGGVDAKELAQDLAEQDEMSAAKVVKAINRLEEVGAVKVDAEGTVKATSKKVDVEGAAEAAVEEQEAYRRYRVGRVDLMKAFAETRQCRRHYVLNYFGEASPPTCGNCDNCDTGVAEKEANARETAAEAGDRPFALNAKVTHKKFGLGVVMRYEEGGKKVVILFDTEGYKSLVTEVVVANGLMEAAD